MEIGFFRATMGAWDLISCSALQTNSGSQSLSAALPPSKSLDVNSSVCHHFSHLSLVSHSLTRARTHARHRRVITLHYTPRIRITPALGRDAIMSIRTQMNTQISGDKRRECQVNQLGWMSDTRWGHRPLYLSFTPLLPFYLFFTFLCPLFLRFSSHFTSDLFSSFFTGGSDIDNTCFWRSC